MFSHERWKVVPILDGIYEMSNKGRVKKSHTGSLLTPVVHNSPKFIYRFSSNGVCKAMGLDKLFNSLWRVGGKPKTFSLIEVNKIRAYNGKTLIKQETIVRNTKKTKIRQYEAKIKKVKEAKKAPEFTKLPKNMDFLNDITFTDGCDGCADPNFDPMQHMGEAIWDRNK